MSLNKPCCIPQWSTTLSGKERRKLPQTATDWSPGCPQQQEKQETAHQLQRATFHLREARGAAEHKNIRAFASSYLHVIFKGKNTRQPIKWQLQGREKNKQEGYGWKHSLNVLCCTVLILESHENILNNYKSKSNPNVKAKAIPKNNK